MAGPPLLAKPKPRFSFFPLALAAEEFQKKRRLQLADGEVMAAVPGKSELAVRSVFNLFHNGSDFPSV